jgi:hypothetical protein
MMITNCGIVDAGLLSYYLPTQKPEEPINKGNRTLMLNFYRFMKKRMNIPIDYLFIGNMSI